MIRFNLRDKKAKGLTMIQLLYSYHSKRVRMSTGISCHVKDWNNKKQRIYDRFDIYYAKEYNHYLNRLESSINLLIEELDRQQKKISPEEFRNLIRSRCFTKTREPNSDLFWTHFKTFIDFKKSKLTQVTDYDLALRKHLKKVEEKLQRQIVFSDFYRNSQFLNELDTYLRFEAPNIKGEQGLSVNTIGKQYKNIKVFLNWCFDEQLIPHFSIKHIVVERSDIDAIYLTEKELQKLDKLTLTDQLEICRDLFLIGCETGLRFSDFCSIHPQQIKDGVLEVRPKKTRNSSGKRILIPLSKRVLKIVKKNNGVFPQWPAGRLNDFNQLLRKCGKIAQLNDIHLIEKRTSGSVKEFMLKKWELMSSHTCRRTFCTLKFLSGMPSHVIMKFSGHSTEKNFLKYLKLDAELNADKYRSYFR